MDGMETLRMIMRSAPLPVIVFSTHSKEGAYATFKALALGAIDFVPKPKDAAGGHLETVANELIEKIKVAKRASGSRSIPRAEVELPRFTKKRPRTALNRIIGGISGWPDALVCSLSPPVSLLCLQRMPEVGNVCGRLDSVAGWKCEAKSAAADCQRVISAPQSRLMVRRMPRRGPLCRTAQSMATVLLSMCCFIPWPRFQVTAVGF